MNCRKEDMLLYAVTDRSWLGGETLAEQVERALEGGVTLLQLREKALDEEAFLREAVRIKNLCDRYKVPLIINDNVQIAQEIGAGVHLGSADMNPAAAREILGPERIIGVSARTVESAMLAQEQGADYLGVGAVFPTGTKQDAKTIDREMLRMICQNVFIPVVAIGGITEDNVRKLAGSGVAGIAVVSAIFAQKDIEAAAGRLRRLEEEYIV